MEKRKVVRSIEFTVDDKRLAIGIDEKDTTHMILIKDDADKKTKLWKVTNCADAVTHIGATNLRSQKGRFRDYAMKAFGIKEVEALECLP